MRIVDFRNVNISAFIRKLVFDVRLLREMGWKEEGSEDEGVYAPLTEDEMKEFENLSKLVCQWVVLEIGFKIALAC